VRFNHDTWSSFEAMSRHKSKRTETYIHSESKKVNHEVFVITSTDTGTDGFLKFLHWHIEQEICSIALKIPPHLKRVATLLCDILMSENQCVLQCAGAILLRD